MKIKISLLLSISLLFSLFSCGKGSVDIGDFEFNGANIHIGNDYAVIDLSEAESEFSFTVKRSAKGEGAIYFVSELYIGAATVTYRYGGRIVNTESTLTEAVSDERIDSFGGYVEGSSVTFTVSARDAATGKIILSFRPISELCNEDHLFDKGSISYLPGAYDARYKVFKCRICGTNASCAINFEPDGQIYDISVTGETEYIIENPPKKLASGELIILKVRKTTETLAVNAGESIYHPYKFDSNDYDVFYLLMPNQSFTIHIYKQEQSTAD